MKSQQIILNHKDILNPDLVYGKTVNGLLVKSNYIISNEEKININFSDSFCKYDINITNSTFQPQYKINM